MPTDTELNEIMGWHLTAEETDQTIQDLENLVKVMEALKTQGVESVQRAIGLAKLYRQDRVVRRALDAVEAVRAELFVTMDQDPEARRSALLFFARRLDNIRQIVGIPKKDEE